MHSSILISAALRRQEQFPAYVVRHDPSTLWPSSTRLSAVACRDRAVRNRRAVKEEQDAEQAKPAGPASPHMSQQDSPHKECIQCHDFKSLNDFPRCLLDSLVCPPRLSPSLARHLAGVIMAMRHFMHVARCGGSLRILACTM